MGRSKTSYKEPTYSAAKSYVMKRRHNKVDSTASRKYRNHYRSHGGIKITNSRPTKRRDHSKTLKGFKTYSYNIIKRNERKPYVQHVFNRGKTNSQKRPLQSYVETKPSDKIYHLSNKKQGRFQVSNKYKFRQKTQQKNGKSEYDIYRDYEPKKATTYDGQRSIGKEDSYKSFTSPPKVPFIYKAQNKDIEPYGVKRSYQKNGGISYYNEAQKTQNRYETTNDKSIESYQDYNERVKSTYKQDGGNKHAGRVDKYQEKYESVYGKEEGIRPAEGKSSNNDKYPTESIKATDVNEINDEYAKQSHSESDEDVHYEYEDNYSTNTNSEQYGTDDNPKNLNTHYDAYNPENDQYTSNDYKNYESNNYNAEASDHFGNQVPYNTHNDSPYISPIGSSNRAYGAVDTPGYGAEIFGQHGGNSYADSGFIADGM